jgi:transcriptional regulator with XRE-family HTH domain
MNRKKHEAEKKNFAIILGQVLQRLRLERNMSLLDVARAARISEATICRYEQGARVNKPLHEMTLKDVRKVAKQIRLPDVFTIYKISSALGITLDQMMEMCIDIVEQAKRKVHGRSEEG